uniref:Uncharacterized protein n=1 Tax=Tetraselmis sp. GSL018 TaxID=582737 RepID=A0A061RQC1_9CHLO
MFPRLLASSFCGSDRCIHGGTAWGCPSSRWVCLEARRHREAGSRVRARKGETATARGGQPTASPLPLIYRPATYDATTICSERQPEGEPQNPRRGPMSR